jgi:nicotinamide-nucleotide amidase
MKAEIIAVGTELLMGDVVNSNAAWISKRLAELGVDVFHHTTVGDNQERIKQVIRQALERAELLIFTGGLGPTDDDLTIPTIAEAFGANLIKDAESEAAIRAIFERRGIPLPESNLKQALKPEGAKTLHNPIGTAPGIAWDVSAQYGKPAYLLSFPGVPKELIAMWEQGAEEIRSWQAQLGEKPEVLICKSLRFAGISESALGEVLADLMSGGNPTVAPYVGQGDIRIRIAAKARNEDEAQELIEPVRLEILKRASKFYFGEDDATLESRIAEMLSRKGLSVSTAESCTGGLISSRLTDVPGSSAYTFINFVTYGNTEKTRFAEVRPETLMQYGAVSPQVAAEMAIGVRRQSGCDIGLSVTGIAGPEGGSAEKPVGLAYVGICGLGERGENDSNECASSDVIVKKVLANSNFTRKDIKFWFSQYALYFLLRYLQGGLKTDFPEVCQVTSQK